MLICHGPQSELIVHVLAFKKVLLGRSNWGSVIIDFLVIVGKCSWKLTEFSGILSQNYVLLFGLSPAPQLFSRCCNEPLFLFFFDKSFKAYLFCVCALYFCVQLIMEYSGSELDIILIELLICRLTVIRL